MKNMRCRSCKVERNEPLSLWDRFKVWLLQHLHEELNDEKADAFTSGFGDGYTKGYVEATNQALERKKFDDLYKPKLQPIPLDCQLNLDGVIDARTNAKGGISLFLGGRELEAEELTVLKQESDALLRTRLWAIMQETVKQKAIEKAVNESTNWEQTLSGKMMLHSLGLLKAVVDATQRATVPPKQKK